MFIDTSDHATACRLVSLLYKARGLAQRFRAAVYVIVNDTEFTINIISAVRDDLLLPRNAALVTADMDDEALGVCAVQIASARCVTRAISYVLDSCHPVNTVAAAKAVKFQ